MASHQQNWIAGRFRPKKQLGEGTYGVAFIAQDMKDNSIVVLKQIRNRSTADGINFSALQEIQHLSELDHPNIVRYIGSFYHSRKLFIVTEFIPLDLSKLIHQGEKTIPFTPGQIKCIFRMILQGIAYLHDNFILHRDLKPNNIMINASGIVKIIDFGLSCVYPPDQDTLSPQAFTIWYRPPEVAFCDPFYGPPADIWSLGCIFGELILGSPLFNCQSSSNLDLLQMIADRLGPVVWPGCDKLSAFVLVQPRGPVPSLKAQFPAARPDAIDLLQKMLTLDPSKRITAKEALDHPYFSLPPEMSLPCDLPVSCNMQGFLDATTMILTTSMAPSSALMSKGPVFAPGTSRVRAQEK